MSAAAADDMMEEFGNAAAAEETMEEFGNTSTTLLLAMSAPSTTIPNGSNSSRKRPRVDHTDQSLSEKHLPEPIPVLPRDASVLLLIGIDGLLTCTAYARQTLRDYITASLSRYLSELADRDDLDVGKDELRKLYQSLKKDWSELDSSGDEEGGERAARVECERCEESVLDAMGKSEGLNGNAMAKNSNVFEPHPAMTTAELKSVVESWSTTLLKYNIRRDGILTLQGKLFSRGRSSSELSGHIYPDFIPALRKCKALGVTVSMFAKTSVQEQRHCLRISSQGNLQEYVASHFDPVTVREDIGDDVSDVKGDDSIGADDSSNTDAMADPNSYRRIAQRLHVDISKMVVLGIGDSELAAAREAGARAVLRRRPAEWSEPITGQENYPICCSMMQLFGNVYG